MCGRFVSASPPDQIARYFDAVDETGSDADREPNYNVAPTDDVYTVANDDGRRRLTITSWGLLVGDGANPLINARAETLAERPAFKEAFEQRRCLIPADGFFEWDAMPGGAKQPYVFAPVDARPIGFAGVYGRRRTCAIVTSEARPPVDRLHDRMPVVVAPDDWATWLDPHADPSELFPLLAPPPETALRARPVSTRVNDVRNNDPSLLHDAPPPPQPLSLF